MVTVAAMRLIVIHQQWIWRSAWDEAAQLFSYFSPFSIFLGLFSTSGWEWLQLSVNFTSSVNCTAHRILGNGTYAHQVICYSCCVSVPLTALSSTPGHSLPLQSLGKWAHKQRTECQQDTILCDHRPTENLCSIEDISIVYHQHQMKFKAWVLFLKLYHHRKHTCLFCCYSVQCTGIHKGQIRQPQLLLS